MAITESTVKRWGNSLGMIIPQETAKQLKLQENQEIIVEITLKKREQGFGIFRGARPFKREESILER